MFLPSRSLGSTPAERWSRQAAGAKRSPRRRPPLAPCPSPRSGHGQPTVKQFPPQQRVWAPLAYLSDIGNKILPEGQAASNEPHGYDMMSQAHDVLIEPVRRKRRTAALREHQGRRARGRARKRGPNATGPSALKDRHSSRLAQATGRGHGPALTWRDWCTAGRWRRRSRTAPPRSSCRGEAAWPELRGQDTRGRGAWAGEPKTHATVTRDLCYLLTSQGCEGLRVTAPRTQPSLSPGFSIPRACKLWSPRQNLASGPQSCDP